ncbi:translation initiation factor IF-2-like [Pipra filicauda]|uniref:Translation initiation factor IF-2-like n=1 Tax=Pipra filicauda TaxID=649802 RepID=A0A7R5KL81_9PASS|nr:translation initiation factor IF-2-like [Pipra filicauda]
MRSSGQRACRPAYRGLRLLPGPQSAWDTRALAPTYRGALGPKACGGSFSPLRGAPDPLPANGAVAPHRLPAEGAQRLPDPDPAYRRVHTQGATELGLPPQHQVPGSRARHWGSWPKALSWAPRAGRAHAQPHACERPGDPAGHPPDYRGSLQPPAEQGGRTKPHLGGRPPEARHSQQRPRGLRPPGTGPPAPRTGGGPRWHVASRTGSPAARVAVPAPPLTGFAPSSGTRGKPLSTLRPFWPVRSPGASLRLSSPARRRGWLPTGWRTEPLFPSWEVQATLPTSLRGLQEGPARSLTHTDKTSTQRGNVPEEGASSVRRAVGSRPCRRAGRESLGLAPGLRTGQKGLSALRGKGHGL